VARDRHSSFGKRILWNCTKQQRDIKLVLVALLAGQTETTTTTSTIRKFRVLIRLREALGCTLTHPNRTGTAHALGDTLVVVVIS
jgi:hypothetical protein